MILKFVAAMFVIAMGMMAIGGVIFLMADGQSSDGGKCLGAGIAIVGGLIAIVPLFMLLTGGITYHEGNNHSTTKETEDDQE